jgi:glycosyltransferase involved in cell wall biosynthesis
VLHVAHHALPHLGGLEAVVDAETTALGVRGWRVRLLTSATDHSPGTFRQRGVDVVRIRAWNGLETRFGVPFPVFSPRVVPALFAEVRRADIVHVHDALYLTSWVAAFWCWVLRRPYVVHRHVGFVQHSSLVVRLVQRAVLGTIARLVLERAALVVAIDEHVATGLADQLSPGARVEVLGNGVDVDAFRPALNGEREAVRGDLGLAQDEPVVLFAGRFVPKKGFPWVTAAASDSYRIAFAGGDRPPSAPDPRLTFLGTVPAERMPAVYRCADVFVAASVGECPLTVLEALSSGLPVVLHDDPALRSPWTSGPGAYFVDMSTGDLGEQLDKLLADPESLRSAGSAARDFVARSFSWDAHVDRLETLYRRVLRPGEVAR